MRHKKAHRRLGRTTAHRQALFRNMLTALVNNDRIETTLGKARELKPLADKLITLAKKGTVAARRYAFTLTRDKTAVKKLFSTLVERFGERKGGYTRILKLGFRHGDTADMAILEYLTAEVKASETKTSEDKKSKKKETKPKAETKKTSKKK